jgi:hypothetical protein
VKEARRRRRRRRRGAAEETVSLLQISEKSIGVDAEGGF